MPGLPTQAALLLLYGYIPNQGAADVAVICYVPISVAVTAVTVKTKAWYMLLVTVAAVFELAGWGGRLTTLSAPSASAYGGQQALIIISPLFLLIVQYITLYKLLLLQHVHPILQVTAANIVGGGSMSAASSRIGVGPGRSSGDGSACSAESGNSKLGCGSDRNANAHGSDGHPVLSKIVLVVDNSIPGLSAEVVASASLSGPCLGC